MINETRGKLGILCCEGGKYFAEKVMKKIKSKMKTKELRHIRPIFIKSN